MYKFQRASSSSSSQNCYTFDSIIKMGGKVIENSDGSVSVFMLNNIGALTPVSLSMACCNALGKNYDFDIDTQKCLWKDTKACGLNEVFKVVLNPKGNDGTLFYLEENETCELSVDFDYLFKVNCSTLSNMVNGVNPNGVTPQISVSTYSSQKIALQTKISEQQNLCASYDYQLEQLSGQINSTPYSIHCDGTHLYNPVNISKTEALPYFNRTAFGSNPSVAPFGFYLYGQTSFQLPSNPSTYCLTEPDGLNAWRTILGEARYQSFLNGDPNSYTCADVDKIVQQNTNNVLKKQPVLVNTCSVPFGSKTKLLVQYNNVLKLKEVCNAKIIELSNNLSVITLQAEIGVTNQTQNIACNSPIDFFETFSVSMTIDLVTSANTLQTVYEQNLLGPIGSGNLYNYLINNKNSGFYICGDPNSSETNFSGCTPMVFEFQGSNASNVTACQGVMSNILTALHNESGLNNIDFENSLPVSALTSDWLHFNTLITDANVLKLIKNQKIKVSFKINYTCDDFCVLVDEISLNKICTKVDGTNLFITQPPGFNLERIRDNKKSWVANTTPVNRVFEIDNSLGANPIRQTNYDVNDERLVINTKEIDLDLNVASAIENDVWCYISDNPCLLSATTIADCPCDDRLTTCFKDYFDIVTWTGGTVFGGTLEDIATEIRARRDAWIKAYNEWELAVPPVFNFEASPFTILPEPAFSDLTNTYNSTHAAYLSALNRLNLVTHGYMLGYTQQPYALANQYQPIPLVIKDSCGDIMTCMGKSNFLVYPVANNLGELEIYVQDPDNPSTLVDLTPLVQYGNVDPTFAPTATTGEFFCTIMGNYINQHTSILFSNFNYETPELVRIKNRIQDNRDLLFVRWDANKKKCMARNRDVFPEAFSFMSPIASVCETTLLATYFDCCDDFRLGNTGTTNPDCQQAVTENYPAYMTGIFRRAFRDKNIKVRNEVALGRQITNLFGIRDLVTNEVPPYGASFSATTTIYRGFVGGDVVYKEIQSIASASFDGQGILSLTIGQADPNSFYHNTDSISGTPNGGSVYPTSWPTQALSGSSCYLPYMGAGDCSGATIAQGPTLHYTDGTKFYVHVDIVDTSGNTYYVTNNDFPIDDANLLVKCPTSASTQTLDINDLLTNIENKKEKVIAQIQQTANYLAYIGYWGA